MLWRGFALCFLYAFQRILVWFVTKPLAIPLKVGSTGMVVIGGAISLNSTIQATNGAHLSTMSAPVFTRTVSTPNPSLANKGHELSQRSYNAHSPLEVDSDSTAALKIFDFIRPITILGYTTELPT